MTTARVAVAYDGDRMIGAKAVVGAIGLPELAGRKVFIKPNLNTSDPAPGSTHIDTLRAMVEMVQEKAPGEIVVGGRSGIVFANSQKVFEENGIISLSKEMGFQYRILDKKRKEDWIRVRPDDSHWRKGFLFSREATESDFVIGLCCLKTHAFGGHFSMSLKLATGLVSPSNMTELHTSPVNMRRMIAEMNTAYAPTLMLMDGVEAFYTGGPMSGRRWKANLTFASADRIALDAVGLAALKMHGTTRKIQDRRIFEQDQIRRAVELGLGISSPEQIECFPVNEKASEIAEGIRAVLDEG